MDTISLIFFVSLHLHIHHPISYHTIYSLPPISLFIKTNPTHLTLHPIRPHPLPLINIAHKRPLTLQNLPQLALRITDFRLRFIKRIELLVKRLLQARHVAGWVQHGPGVGAGGGFAGLEDEEQGVEAGL